MGEEVTMLRWGNIVITNMEYVEATSSDAKPVVKSIYANYNADATNFSKTKKLTWLANVVRNILYNILSFFSSIVNYLFHKSPFYFILFISSNVLSRT